MTCLFISQLILEKTISNINISIYFRAMDYWYSIILECILYISFNLKTCWASTYPKIVIYITNYIRASGTWHCGNFTILYARVKMHSHTSHTLLSSALFEIHHASQPGMRISHRKSHSILAEITHIQHSHFSDAVTGHNGYHALCAICHTQGTFTHA